MKTLYIDIESSPNVAHVWGLFRQNVSLAQVMESQRMICFAAKWADERKVQFLSEHHDGREAMVLAAHRLLSEADVVVTYNGKGYDIPHLNREFLLAGMTAPSPFHHNDLLRTVRSQFRFTSNKLAYVTKALGLQTKASTGGHELWVKCMAGDPVAWAKMRRYNMRDVIILQKLDERLGSWRKGTPNARLFDEADVCPDCGAEGTLVKEGFALTINGKYQRYHCSACGKWSKSGRRIEGTDIRGIS